MQGIVFNVITIIVAIAALIISFISLYYSIKVARDERDFETKLGIVKELQKAKLAIMQIYSSDGEQTINLNRKYKVPESLDITTTWWDEKSNNLLEWNMFTIYELNAAYESIRMIKNKKGQSITGTDLKKINDNLDLVFKYNSNWLMFGDDPQSYDIFVKNIQKGLKASMIKKHI